MQSSSKSHKEGLEPKWFPFYTKSRFEKKALINLEKAGYEAYLPLKKTMRNWSDRKKMVEIPLFSSYIFVRVPQYKLHDIMQINGIVRYITFNRQPAIVRDSEIEMIKLVLSDKTEVEVVDGFLKEGVEVSIISGVLKGYKGRVVDMSGNKKVILEIESINKTMLVTVDKSSLVGE